MDTSQVLREPLHPLETLNFYLNFNFLFNFTVNFKQDNMNGLKIILQNVDNYDKIVNIFRKVHARNVVQQC